jgi:hypothetical protein
LAPDAALLAAAVPPGSKLRVFDARPRVNAHANRVRGGGVETPSQYGPWMCDVEFLGIGNIHAVRHAFVALKNALSDAACWPAPSQAAVQVFEASEWAEQLRLLLRGAARIASAFDGRPCIATANPAAQQLAAQRAADGWVVDDDPEILSFLI